MTSLDPDSAEVSEQRLAPVAGAAADESDPEATIPLPAPVFDAPAPSAERASVEAVSVEVASDEPPAANPSTPVLPVGLDLSAFDAPLVEPEIGATSGASTWPRVLFVGATLATFALAVFALGRWTATEPTASEAAVVGASAASTPSATDVAVRVNETVRVSETEEPTTDVAPNDAVEDAVAANETSNELRTRPRNGRTARPVGRGTVAVTASGGWGEVFVGGRKLGVTPGRFELPAGATTLRVVPASGRPQTVRVVVPVDGEARVRVALDE